MSHRESLMKIKHNRGISNKLKQSDFIEIELIDSFGNPYIAKEIRPEVKAHYNF